MEHAGSDSRPLKVALLGCGGVGSSVAFNLLRRRRPYEVVVLDRKPTKIASHVMDLEQTLLLGAPSTIRAGDAADLADADVLVMSAAAPLTLNTSRLVYLQDNAQIVRETVAKLPGEWAGSLLMVTNPVDALCTWLHRQGRLDRSQILGYTLNDSLRLRTGVSNATGAPPHAVEAWVVGEHGDSSVPLLDRVRIDGRPVVLDEAEEAVALEFIRTWYTRHVALDSGRTSTWTSGLGIAAMIDAIAEGSDETWPASVWLDGEYGLEDVSVSVPVVLGRAGLERIVEWELTGEQHVALAASAAVVREATDRIGVETNLDTATAGKETT